MRRRDFLRASALGAGVALLEGCDRAREEQFIVQPARRPGALQGESLWRASVCGQCDAGCGILVRVVDGDAKKIEGAPEHPVNRGGVCALGHSALQELYNPDRLLAPQRGSGARGDGAFEALSWEDGLAGAIEAIGGARPEGLAFVGRDRYGFVGALMRRLAGALGAPGPAFVEPLGVDVERRAARLALGVDELPYFDVEMADYVLSIGAPFVDRWRSPVHYTRALSEMRRGRRGRRGWLVQAEPRMSLTAANADVWLPLRPGTEGTFARVIAGVLLQEAALGRGPIDRYRRLFPDDPPSVEAAAEECGIPAEQIHRTAVELGEAERRVVVAGGSAAAHTNGVYNVTAALGLNVLLDSLGRQGGVYAPQRFDLAGTLAPERAETSMADLVTRLRGEGPGVDTLVVVETDLAHMLPGGLDIEDALANVGSVIVLGSFLDDTALHADLLLPLHTEMERFNAMEPAASVGVPVLTLSDSVLEPMGEGHHPADVLLAVATALGDPIAGQFPWTSFSALVRERIEADAARLPGGALADSTASFYFGALAAHGIFGDVGARLAPSGPTSRAPRAAAAGTDGDEDAYPFHLLPFESLKVGSGRGANRPWLQEMPDPLSTVMWNAWVELCPSDAEALGVHDGDVLRIESPVGGVEAHAVIDPAVRPGAVCMPMGHGHREYGRYAATRGANPLALVGDLRVDGTDEPAWAATRVRVERVGEGRLVRFGRGYGDHGEGELIPVGWAPHGVPTPNEAMASSQGRGRRELPVLGASGPAAGSPSRIDAEAAE